MRQIEQTALWAMIHEAETATGDAMFTKWESALDEFEKAVRDYCQRETNPADRTRELRSRRGRFEMILDEPTLWEGVNGLHAIIMRAIAIIDTELDIVRMDLDHSELRSAPSAPIRGKWGGKVVDLLELHVGPQTAGCMQHHTGMPMTYEESVEFLEQTYGVTVSNASDRRAKILERADVTSFTDTMRKVLLLEADKHNSKPRRK